MEGRGGRGQLIIDSDFDLILIRYIFWYSDGACDSFVVVWQLFYKLVLGLIMR